MLHEVVDRLMPVAAGLGLGLEPGAWTCSLYNNHGPVSTSVVAFLFGERDRFPRVIVKLSRQTHTIAREEAALRHLSPILPERVPRPYLGGELRGVAFLAMEGLDADAISASQFEDRFPAVLAAVLELHQAAMEAPGGGDLPRELLETLGQFEARCAVSELGLVSMCSRVREQIQGLAGLGLPATPQHGDFSLGNVLVRGDGEIVVVDWEDYASVRLPGYDLVMLFATLPDRDFSGDPRLRRLLWDGLRRYAKHLKVDQRWLPVLVPLHLARLFLSSEANGRNDSARAALSHLVTLARGGAELPAALVG
jgi:aminoglycoside phosphotransferase (APT) family kinase protein